MEGFLSRRAQEAKARRDEASANYQRAQQQRREPPAEGLSRFAKQQGWEKSAENSHRQNSETVPTADILREPRQQRQRSPEPRQERMSVLPEPPLPSYARPMVTPVMDLKRETANHWDFSPEAREQLYDTPTIVRYQPYSRMFERDDPAGWAQWDKNASPRMMVYEPEGGRPTTVYGRGGAEATWPSSGAGVMAHEFGHTWQSDEMPTHLQDEWSRRDWINSPVWSDTARPGFAREQYSGAMSPENQGVMQRETYANTVMQSARPGLEIPTWYRDKYFAGLFNDSPSQWQDPFYGATPPIPDILRERVEPLRWSNDFGYKG